MSNFAISHLNAHNAYRAKHGCPPLTLDDGLSQFAQDWANQLGNKRVMQHRPGNKYGENIYMASGNPPPTVDGATPVKSWYDEIQYYRYGSPGFASNTGHFTQVVWKATTKMGVGIAQNGSGQTFVVANYDPPGNMNTKIAFQNNVPGRIN